MMNKRARRSVEAYNTNAATLCELYNSLATEDVLPGIRSILPVRTEGRTHYDAIDLGCGSGRDAFWLAERGFHVVGVDASIEMLRHAWDMRANLALTTYIEDQIPALSRVRQRGQSYDFFLMSAVWMHLDKAERKKMIETMAGLAREGATAYISLRHGPSPEDRPMFRTSVREIKDLVADIGGRMIVLPNLADAQGRKGVSWESVAVQFRKGGNETAKFTHHPAFD